MIVGAHCSGGVKGAIDKAASIGADAVQLFTQSPRAWRTPEPDQEVYERFRARREEAGLAAVFCHAIYLVNLAAPNDDVFEKSVATMRSTMQIACAIEADGVVFHVGSHMGSGFERALDRVLPAMEQVLDLCSEKTWLLMENSAGAGGTIGRSVEELATLFERLDRHPRLGVCLDSCHLFVSGIDVTDPKALDAALDELDHGIGLDRLRCLHVNDSKAPLGSNRDRHENIGEGLIGEKMGVFLANRRLRGLPGILEVAGKDDRGPDADEVRKTREIYERWTKPKRAQARTPASRRSAAKRHGR